MDDGDTTLLSTAEGLSTTSDAAAAATENLLRPIAARKDKPRAGATGKLRAIQLARAGARGIIVRGGNTTPAHTCDRSASTT